MTTSPTPFKWIDPKSIPTRAEQLSSGLAFGVRGADGRFERDRGGPTWLVFDEPNDTVYWNPRTGQIATYYGRAFAVGELAINNAATYALGGSLTIFATVGQWIEANGRGIFIHDWGQAFDKLRDAPRIECDGDLVAALYRKHMKPARMPGMTVRRRARGGPNAG